MLACESKPSPSPTSGRKLRQAKTVVCTVSAVYQQGPPRENISAVNFLSADVPSGDEFTPTRRGSGSILFGVFFGFFFGE